MDLGRYGFFLVFVSSFLFWQAGSGEPLPQGVPGAVAPGIVVEQVTKRSEAEKMGFLPGDVLLSWSGKGRHADFHTTFDLLETEVEQLPRGAITLEGRSGNENKAWEWREETGAIAKEGSWGLAVRPNLQGALLSAFKAGVELERSGKPLEAARHWQTVAQEANRQYGSQWLVSWFWLRSASALAADEKEAEAEQACDQAISPASRELAVQMFRACGDIFFQYSRDEGAKYYQQALDEAQKSGAGDLTIASLFNVLARISYTHENYARGVKQALQAVKLQEAIVPNSLAYARSLHRAGTLMQQAGELDESREYFLRALALREKLAPTSTGMAATLQNMADTLTQRGDLSEAQDYAVRALALYEKLVPESLLLAGCMVDVSSLAEYRGRLSEAETYLRKALSIQTRLAPQGAGMAASLNNLGLIFSDRGENAEAESYFLQALEVKQKLAPDSLNVALTLANLAMVNDAMGNAGKAEDYLRRAREIREKLSPKSIELGIIYSQTGDMSAEKGDLDSAESYYRKALDLLEPQVPFAPETADAFNGLASVAFRKKDLSEAEKNYRRALQIREEQLGPASERHAETLMNLAEIARLRGDNDAAAQLFESGLQALESQTSWLGGKPEARAAFRANFAEHVKSYLDLLIAQGKPEQAFYAVERARGRTLLEMLDTVRLEAGQASENDLLQREKSLQADIVAKSERRTELLHEKHTDEQLTRAGGELRNLVEQYQILETQIRDSRPDYSALTQPQLLTASQARLLLDQDTVLLEYSLGREQGYVFALASESMAVGRLPGRDQIEQTIKRMHEALTERNRTMKNETAAARQRRLSKAESSYDEGAARLSELILTPVSKSLRKKRLLIVSDGGLHYIPFSALPDPSSPRRRPLVLEHEIVNLPSASILEALRKKQMRHNPPPKLVAVIADPVFSAGDERLGAKTAMRLAADSTAVAPSLAPSAANDRLTRSVRDIGMDHLSRLPFARREAESIMSLTTPSQRTIALDFDATRAAAVAPEMSQYRIIHVATHGLLDSQHPELSGLVFSLVDRNGKSRDGFLGLQDVYNLKLSADLVVLSACQTGLGKEIDGEGLIGLTRGFMYAGAERVVASLWNVSDVATAELMKYFYQGMLHDHLPPAAALRRAQLQLRQHTRWKSPYYWAAFQIQGDWN